MHSPAAKPIVGDDEPAAVDAVLALRPRQGPQVAAFEEEFSDLRGGCTLRSRQLRDVRAASGSDRTGDRCWRRGHRAQFHVRRDGELRESCRCHACVR